MSPQKVHLLQLLNVGHVWRKGGGRGCFPEGFAVTNYGQGPRGIWLSYVHKQDLKGTSQIKLHCFLLGMHSFQGQYVKWVSPNGPADLAGLLPGDHVLHVDGYNVTEETHQKVYLLFCNHSVSQC